MTIQQMLLGSGGLRKLLSTYITSLAGNPNGFTSAASGGSAATGAVAPPSGYSKVVMFIGWGAQHMYLELTAAQFAASTFNLQLANGSGGFFANLQKNGANYLTVTQAGAATNNSGFTVDASRLFANTDAVNGWAVIEFYG